MIKLSDNRIALLNLGTTITALERLDAVIKSYSADKSGPAYCKFTNVNGQEELNVQIDRDLIVPTLQAQRKKLVDYLAALGIEA
jgi:hypothetical protein